MTSPAQDLFAAIAPLGADAHEALDEILEALSVVQLAALRYDWPEFWARSKQLIPDGAWRSFGFLTGRGFGKTRAIAEWVTSEVMAGRAMRIGLAAQNEDKTYEVMVDGESGLVRVSPPWFKARVENGIVHWPNGAQAFVYTPHEPQNVHGPEHHLFWASEISKWPAATRDEMMADLRRGLRLGYGKLVWDSTPRRRNPLIRALLERAKKNPERHIVVRGSMRENEDNLTPEFVQEQIDEFGGTQAGREQIEGEYLDDDEGALFRAEWFRRGKPKSIVRRILVVDPAIGSREDSDKTGMGELALGNDGLVYVCADYSDRHGPEEWADLALTTYVDHDLDYIIAELNRGGQLVTRNLRAAAKERNLRVHVLEANEIPHKQKGVVYVREVHAKGEKAERAAPVATAYQKGRVVHLEGADLADLEELMTTWEPPPPGSRARGRRSPDAMDAVVHGVVDLLGLSGQHMPDRAGQVRAAQAVAERIKPRAVTPAAVLGVRPRRERWGSKL